jgi:hypothetical protein
MNHYQKCPSLIVRNPAWRRAIERLGESLEQNSEHSNAELIERMGRHMFGDLWRKPKSSSGCSSTPVG